MTTEERDFLQFYLEQTWEEMRHLENLRERVSGILVTLSLAISGFIIQQKFASELKPLIWFIIILGLFGLLMTRKIYQIHQRGQKRLDNWYKLIESTFGDESQIFNARNLADNENKKKFRLIASIPHNVFWSAIYFFIVIGGIYFLFEKPVSEVQEKNVIKTVVLIKNKANADSAFVIIDTVKTITSN